MHFLIFNLSNNFLILKFHQTNFSIIVIIIIVEIIIIIEDIVIIKMAIETSYLIKQDVSNFIINNFIKLVINYMLVQNLQAFLKLIIKHQVIL